MHQRFEQVRLFLQVLSAAAVAYGLAETVAWAAFGSTRALATGVIVGGFGIWLLAVPRRSLDRRPVASVVAGVAVVLFGVVVSAAVLQPYVSLAAATALLIPIAAALPYLDVRPLRALMVVAWAATVGTAALGFLPDDPAIPVVVSNLIELWGLTVASGVVLFVLYQSSERLKESGREFRRLFRLSADLAETTEPAVLGELVARHLAEATGFDECIIYALEPESGRLAPFGSHPAERSLQADPETLAERPALGRVVHDGARIVVDLSDEAADPVERDRLRAIGHQTVALLPLAARSDPVGVAELASRGRRPVDERRLALARTLAFEAALAIENGRLYRRLRHEALHDPLTGLANRSLFGDRVAHALARQQRHPGASVAVLFLDLDDFKVVNDTLGHARGDRLLALVAERLGAVVRPADTVARLGGDEFALLLEEVGSPDEARSVAERILRGLGELFDLGTRSMLVWASIGIALWSANGITADELIHQADVAMYEAKRSGKGRAVLFGPGLRARSETPTVIPPGAPRGAGRG